jgi:hypothetical protein
LSPGHNSTPHFAIPRLIQRALPLPSGIVIAAYGSRTHSCDGDDDEFEERQSDKPKRDCGFDRHHLLAHRIRAGLPHDGGAHSRRAGARKVPRRYDSTAFRAWTMRLVSVALLEPYNRHLPCSTGPRQQGGDDHNRSLGQQQACLVEFDRLRHAIGAPTEFRQEPAGLRPVPPVKQKARKARRRPQL